MVLGIQIVGILFGLFLCYYTFLYYKKKLFTQKELTFWILVWLSFVVFSLIPDLLEPILKKVAFARVLDFFIIIGFMFILSILFYIYTIVRKNQKQIEEIIRQVAIEKASSEKKQ